MFKTYGTAAAALLLALLLAACGGNVTTNPNLIKGSGNVKTETREVSGISRVVMSASAELQLEQGDTEALTLEAEDNLLPLFTTEVKDGTLTIDTKPNSSYGNTKPIIFRLTVKDLDAVTANASGTAILSTFKTDDLTLTVDNAATLKATEVEVNNKLEIKVTGSGSLAITRLGSSEIHFNADNSATVAVNELTAETLTGELDGAATVTLVAGTVPTQDITAKSSSTYNAQGVSGATATINATGSATVRVNVSDTLTAFADSSASVIYSGNPANTQATQEASGTVKPG